jgi:hypothetical protein
MKAEPMIAAHPQVRGDVSRALIRSSEECLTCFQICVSCADACTAEDSVRSLGQCIRLNLDCADICMATAALASRRTGSNESVLRGMLELCITACRTCAEECQRHAQHHEHCRICAETCRRCERTCTQGLQEVGSSAPPH